MRRLSKDLRKLTLSARHLHKQFILHILFKLSNEEKSDSLGYTISYIPHGKREVNVETLSPFQNYKVTGIKFVFLSLLLLVSSTSYIIWVGEKFLRLRLLLRSLLTEVVCLCIVVRLLSISHDLLFTIW